MLHAYNSTVQLAAPLAMSFGDSLVFGVDAFVYGQDDLVTSLGAGNHSILVSGAAVTAAFAFTFGSFSEEASACRFTVTETGLIHGIVGLVYLGANLDLTNAGTISADGVVIVLEGGLASLDNRIVNSGTIVGATAISGNPGQVSALTLVNSGTLEGTAGFAISMSNAANVADVVVNSGLILGDVLLGGGGDLFDNRAGTVVGRVAGDDGNDLFRPGAAEDIFDGGIGIDSLDFRTGSGAVEIALDGAWEATGWAEGDSYTGFERVTGTAFADRIGGSAVANGLTGGGGADSLYGQAGDDTLAGGGGADSLFGGSGNDSFQFRRLAECGDRLGDFSSTGAGNNDRFLISTAFGGGLAAGTLAAAQFVSRADNLAQDANDRFVYRTTDRTLWFDADGSGAGAAVLVATLQAGATMSAADIVIF